MTPSVLLGTCGHGEKSGAGIVMGLVIRTL